MILLKFIILIFDVCTVISRWNRHLDVDVAWPWTSPKMTFQTEFNNDFKDFKSQIDNLQGQLCTFMDNCFDKEIFFTLYRHLIAH